MIFVNSHLISLSLRGTRLLSYQTRTNQNKLAIILNAQLHFEIAKSLITQLKLRSVSHGDFQNSNPLSANYRIVKKVYLTIVLGPMRIKFWYYFLKEAPKICAKNDKCLGCRYCILSDLDSRVKTTT